MHARGRVVGVIGLVWLVGAGCGSTRTASAPRSELFAATDSYLQDGAYMGTALVRVDRRSLQPFGRRLRLGDAVTSRRFSPDRRTLAFGGVNFGEILFVALASPTQVRRLTVVPDVGSDGSDVEVAGWPRPDRLIAVATRLGVWWAPHPSRLLVVDPMARRVIRRRPLGGGVLDTVALRDGTVALLVTRSGVGRFAQVVMVRPDGSSWRAHLGGLNLRSGAGVRVGGISYEPDRIPALASDGRSRVFVVAPDRAIVEIDVRSHTTRYHDVHPRRRYLFVPEAQEPGTGGVVLRFRANAVWLGRDRLAIGGSDELPSRLPDGGTGHRLPARWLAVVDTRRWRLERYVPALRCGRLKERFLCSASSSGFGVDGKQAHGSSLVIYDEGWKVRYRARSSELSWTAAAGRLIIGAQDGSYAAEFDPRNGRRIRAIDPPPLRNGTWPLDLLAWQPR